MLRRNRDSGPRTAEDRARAAAERAARRAAREGRAYEPPPDELFDEYLPVEEPVHHEPPPEDLLEESLPDEQPVHHEPPPPPAPDDADADLAAFDEAEALPPGETDAFVPPPLDPPGDPEPAHEELPPRPPAPVPVDPFTVTLPEAELGQPTEPFEPALDLPPRQPGRPGRRKPAGPEKPKPARPAKQRRPVPGRRRQVSALKPDRSPATGAGRIWTRRIGVLLVLLFILGFGYVVNNVFQPFKDDPSGKQGAATVTIPAGAGVGDIADRLAAAGVIDSAFFFQVNATLTGRRDGLRSGEYLLPRGLSNAAALDALQEGPRVARKRVKMFKLTLSEGRSRREIAALLDKEVDSLEGDYLKATAAAQKARKLGAPRSAGSLEGYLFPATFELPVGATADDLVAAQLKAFADHTAELSYRAAKRKRLTRYDVLIIASMVEREAQIDRERPLIASVIYNRLRRGIPLGIDATIRYQLNNWSRPLRQSELQRDTPYNTRLHRGLPPSPIGNPGLKSIQAAAKPANTRYLYYVVKPGTCGKHAFSRTDAQFQRDVAKYNSAREAKGGKSPTNC